MPTAKFAVGDWVQIYSGPDEDCCAVVKETRWVKRNQWHEACWEYDLGWLFGWRFEGQLTAPRRSSHYDRNGYCDNPARGY
jgi:hypothetical protein